MHSFFLSCAQVRQLAGHPPVASLLAPYIYLSIYLSTYLSIYIYIYEVPLVHTYKPAYFVLCSFLSRADSG